MPTNNNNTNYTKTAPHCSPHFGTGGFILRDAVMKLMQALKKIVLDPSENGLVPLFGRPLAKVCKRVQQVSK